MRSPLPAFLLLASLVPGTALAADAPATSPTAPAAARAISAETATKLAASLPKVALVKPVEKKPAEEPVDLREIDKPANGIVRLPSYVVREQTSKPPVFREQDLYKGDALRSRLARRYYSEGYLAFTKIMNYTPLRFFLPSAEASAMAQFYEDEKLRIKSEVEDHVNMVMRSNPASGAKFQADSRNTFLHWSDLGWSNPAKK